MIDQARSSEFRKHCKKHGFICDILIPLLLPGWNMTPQPRDARMSTRTYLNTATKKPGWKEPSESLQTASIEPARNFPTQIRRLPSCRRCFSSSGRFHQTTTSRQTLCSGLIMILSMALTNYTSGTVSFTTHRRPTTKGQAISYHDSAMNGRI